MQSKIKKSNLPTKIIIAITVIAIALGGAATQRENIYSALATLPRLTVTQNGITINDCEKYSQILVYSDSVTIINCTMTNGDQFAGGVIFIGNNNKAKNVRVTGACRAGFVLEGQFNTLENVEVDRTKDCSGSDADGIRILNSNNTVKDSYCHNLNPEGAIGPHSDCVQGDYQSFQFKNIVIENNVFDSPDAGIQTDGANTDGVLVKNNTIRADRPLNMAGKNIEIVDNDFYGGDSNPFVSIRPGSSNIVFGGIGNGNNICNTAHGLIAPLGAVTTGGYNNFYNVSGDAPRRDSGYSYVNGQLKWPTDKWQTVNPGVCNNFPTNVGTATPPAVTKTTTPTATRTKTPTASPTPIPPSITPSRTVTPSLAPSSTLTFSSVAPTVTYTVTRTATFTPSATPTKTATPAGNLCVRITWWLGVSIRPAPSVDNVSLGPGYSYQRIVPIEAIEKIGSDEWARINYGQWFARKLGTRIYAQTTACP